MPVLNAVLPLFVALSLTPPAFMGPAKSSTSSPIKGAPKSKVKPGKPAKPTKKVATGKLITIPKAKRRIKTVRPRKDPAGSAAMAALLQKFADGNEGTTKFEKKVAKAMARHGVSPAAAKAFMDRVPSGSSNPGKANKATLAAGVAKANGAAMVYLREAISLPPQNIPLPASYSLRATGLVTSKTDDGDGTDEVTALAIVAHPNGRDYDLNTVDLGSRNASPGSQALGGIVFNGAAKDALVITVLIEDDGGNAAAAKAEVENMVAAAAAVASSMADEDRLQVLKAMVDFSIALDSGSNDPSRAARSIVGTKVPASHWQNLWAAQASEDGGMKWKVAVPHTLGAGNYEVLFDVPSKIPKMKTVRLSMSNFKLAGVPADAELKMVAVEGGIGDRSHTFYVDQLSAQSLHPLERRVIEGNVDIRVGGTAVWKEAPGAAQPGKRYSERTRAMCKRARETKDRRLLQKCRALKALEDRQRADARRKGTSRKVRKSIDFSPSTSTGYTTQYSTALGGFVPHQNGKASKPSNKQTKQAPIRVRTTKGRETPRGQIKLTVISGG